MVQELVSQRLNRDDRAVQQRHLHFQPADMDIDGSRRPVVVVSPHFIEKYLTGQYTPRMTQQMFQQRELLCREQHFRTVQLHFVSCQIEREGAICSGGRFPVRGTVYAAKERFDSGDERLGAEGFRDIIIGPEFESD